MNPTYSDYSLAKVPPVNPVNTPQSFGRFEFKYVITAKVRASLEAELRDFMEIDPFCRATSTQSYFVRSLYFDDPGLGDYHEKMDGLLDRSKFRLRTYARGVPEPCFLEIKSRQNLFSSKERTPIDPIALKLIRQRRWSTLARHAPDNPVLVSFVTAACRRNLAPVVTVDYQRRPYISRLDYRFRATMDNSITARSATHFDPTPCRSRPVLDGRTVLEIKFERAVPVWFQRMIGAHELKRISVSKYCLAAEALTLVQNPD